MGLRKDGDGEFGLDCYERLPNENDQPQHTQYADDRLSLEDAAEALIRGGRFTYLELQRWDADEDDWVLLKEYDQSDAGDIKS